MFLFVNQVAFLSETRSWLLSRLSDLAIVQKVIFLFRLRTHLFLFAVQMTLVSRSFSEMNVITSLDRLSTSLETQVFLFLSLHLVRAVAYTKRFSRKFGFIVSCSLKSFELKRYFHIAQVQCYQQWT